jgi:uncharacterized protein (DUF433 family)
MVLVGPRFMEMTATMIANCNSGSLPRELLTLLETTILAEVSENRVRKDIETGLYPSARIVRFDDRRMCFRWSDVFTIAAVYRNRALNGRMRKLVFEKVYSLDCPLNPPLFHWTAVGAWEKCRAVKLDSYVVLDLHGVCEDVRPRVDLYAYGLSRIEEKDGVLGGDAVFKGTRLPVLHVGKMFDRGETIGDIRADYPYLTEDDVKFAQIYYRAHPIVGRPRTRAEAKGDIPLVG